MGYLKRFNEMTWSFSRLHMWEGCPYSFYRRYIEEDEGIDNFYAENGSIMHSIFEKLLKKEMTMTEAPDYYDKQFQMICSNIKESIMQSTYDKCIEYLSVVDEFDFEKYEVIGVEVKLNFKIGKHKFVGFADLILKDKDTGEIILVDHKSSGHLFKKDGSVLKNQAQQFISYKHQAYLYCEGMLQMFGYVPDKIVWHHFKDKGQKSIINYDDSDHKDTVAWAAYTINKIYKDKRFNENKEYMQCYQLCNFREDCEYLEDDNY